MNRRSTILTALALFLAIASTSAAAPKTNFFDKPRAGNMPLFADTIVAKGKGFEIKQSQVDDMYLAFKGHRAAMGEGVPEDLRPKIEADIIEKLVSTQLVLRRATDQDKAKAKEIAATFLVEQKKQIPSEESLRRQLLAVGMTTQDYTNQIHEQAVVKAVIDRELKSQKTVSDEEAKKFYDENPSLFQEPALIRASHVLISTRDKISGKELTPELKLEKKRSAEKIAVRAKTGEDFSKLVREFSADTASKQRGGEYTFARAKDDPRRAMAPEFEAAAFSMAPNQVSDVVETSYGYHVIKTLEKIPSKKVDFAKVQSGIKDTLLREAVQKDLPAYIERLKKEAGVEILISENKR